MKVKQAKELCVVNFPNSLVIFNFRTYRSIILNDTASLVWDFCKKPRDLRQISKFINNRFQVDLSGALKDAKKLILQLKKRKLLVCSKAPKRNN